MRAWICSRMLSVLELPRWHKGRLWAAEVFAGQVIAFAADGAAHVVINGAGVLAGFGWIPDGSLLAVTLGGGCYHDTLADVQVSVGGNRLLVTAGQRGTKPGSVGTRVSSPSACGERRPARPALTGLVRARASARLAGRSQKPRLRTHDTRAA
jgi:hypothetical protein